MTMTPEQSSRARELAHRLRSVRNRIAAATAPDGQNEPHLIVVTKYFPASDVRILRDLGVRDVGENKDQEAAAKAAELADPELNWHFIGQLQSNKAKSVVRYAASVHSVDRLSLVSALGKAMGAEQRRRADGGVPQRPDLSCFIQVDLRPGPAREADPGRGGAAPEDVAGLADAVAGTTGLRLAGLMAVAPLGEDPDAAFGRLNSLSLQLQQNHPQARSISAGMSGDLEAALANGATHLRIGSDVLGARPPVR
ncbi:YggS family pyridoxal phosphate-dependent enzyme [Arthrobacter zhangbolii]|uniref:Pyridoxal phosphate homeostasis protein n=1 Tax=Arthrobacter zhangbolii TaxID=2886936 RepID=A0A9X1M5N1_9MICC|nr:MULTISPECIES: YggS family pyridoxal phosphate-dependent enzyme [Arthrobacter]MCC3271898.1 YggS family pyridoxal phosphate-dependent enzyme [Arthrobacter zhangbolii]MCC3293804.1 YggS family pyridoxal phosphate-dependent enzyme [Arthrobacter zhangbolii]MDN3904974.1 YggS family pyridoxal phosphate-dependent enzyme [Arthrobacter sp. YD2]UON93283.1 YggS family pyridoxal phosphate-dependent enzyme [Arthrobacter zhangbolii]